MNISKLAPWNWFRKEEEQEGRMLPVNRGGVPANYDDFFTHMQQRMDQMFNEFMRGTGNWPASSWPLLGGEYTPAQSGWMKPSVDIGGSEKEYTVSLELPGVSEKDINVEIVGDTLTVSAEKHQESEQKDKNFYRAERSYGSFRRVLSLPEDADPDHIEATFRNGVMTLTVPRKAAAIQDTKRIEVKAA